MLEKLKKIIDKKGLIKVTYALGFRSPSTICNWIKSGNIPNKNIEKLNKFLNRKENKNV